MNSFALFLETCRVVKKSDVMHTQTGYGWLRAIKIKPKPSNQQKQLVDFVNKVCR